MIGKVLKRAKVICSYSILKLLFWIQAIKKAVLDNGGEIKGTARHPLGTSDFSSFLLGAQSSGAQVIALANAGADTVNAVKQAGEFGIVPKQVIATPALFNTDIRSLGLETAAGLRFVTSSYPDMDDGTRRWSAEFLKRRGTMPSMTHAGMYSAAQHYLKAVESCRYDRRAGSRAEDAGVPGRERIHAPGAGTRRWPDGARPVLCTSQAAGGIPRRMGSIQDPLHDSDLDGFPAPRGKRVPPCQGDEIRLSTNCRCPAACRSILLRSLAVIAVLSCGLHALDRDDHVLFIGRFLAQRDQRLILG